MNIAFAWTTPALLAGQKTVTRRHWRDRYAAKFRKGDEVTAYDKNPRFGGKPVAIIRLTADPVKESTENISLGDWEAEGFEYLQKTGQLVNGEKPSKIWNHWIAKPETFFVVRFELVRLLSGLMEKGSGRHQFVASDDSLCVFCEQGEGSAWHEWAASERQVVI